LIVIGNARTKPAPTQAHQWKIYSKNFINVMLAISIKLITMLAVEETIRVDIAEAQPQLLSLLDLVIAGKEILITVNNQPVAKLMSFSPSTSLFGSDKGRIVIADDFDDPLSEFQDYL
jgi:prevent-host-death family protein